MSTLSPLGPLGEERDRVLHQGIDFHITVVHCPDPTYGAKVPTYCLDGSFYDNSEKKGICKLKRNIVIGDLIFISDGMCIEHLKTIFGNNAVLNIFLGTLVNASSGAGTVVGGVLVKSALSALAFFANAERSLVNDTVYQSLLIPAIVKKIGEYRDKKRRDLTESKINQLIENYPINI